MAFNEHGYNTDHMANVYSHRDLIEIWAIAGAAADRLIELATNLERQEGTIKPYILKRADDLHWLAEAADEAREKQVSMRWV